MTPRWFLLAAMLLAGCTSPPSRFYTLSGPTSPSTSASQAGVAIMVGPVAIPTVVDRPEIVVTVGENQVLLDEFNRWASPLGEAIARAIAGNLTVALATQRVTLLGQGASIGADYRVAIDVQRFESVPGSHALLDAAYSVRRVAGGATLSGRTTRREVVGDRSYDTLAAAHSRAVARLADDVATAVRSLAAPSGAGVAPSTAMKLSGS